VTAAKHACWPLEQPRKVRLLANLMGVVALAVLLHFMWLRVGMQPVWWVTACVMLAGMARRLVLRHADRPSALAQNTGAEVDNNREARPNARGAPYNNELHRPAMGHWQVHAGTKVSDGSLQHVWYGWGWITLRIRVFGQPDLITVTVWRANVSPVAWHNLRVWVACELAMVTPPSEAEVR